MSRNESFPALSVARISAHLTGAAVEICPDDIDDVHVMVSGDAPDTLQISFSAGTLRITQRTTAPARARHPGGWTQLTLRVPRAWKGSIDARTRSGRINLRQLSGADLSLRTVSGLVMGSELHFITVRAASLTGAVKLTGLHCERCRLLSASGEMSILGGVLHQGSAFTATGGVSLTLLDAFDALQLASVTGKLDVRAPIQTCDAGLRSITGRIHAEGMAIGDAPHSIRATTVTGPLALTYNLE